VTGIEQEARGEAEKLFPVRLSAEAQSAATWFERGYIAGASRPASPATREAVAIVVQGVLWNAANYPEAVQPRILGQDITGLTAKVVDALAAFDIREKGEA
jgi:hypothetical protein